MKARFIGEKEDIYVPMIKVLDNVELYEHYVGESVHDDLIIIDGSSLQYHNLQNGDGSIVGGNYDFVAVEWLPLEKFIKRAKKKKKEKIKNRKMLLKLIKEENKRLKKTHTAFKGVGDGQED